MAKVHAFVEDHEVEIAARWLRKVREVFGAHDFTTVQLLDSIHVFLKGSVNNLLRSLTQAGIDNFHSRIPQGARNDFGPPVVTIQAGLGN